MRYISILLLIVITACGPTLESRREYVENHQRPPAIEQAILNEKIRIGMTKSDVRASWGEPDTVNKSYFKGGTPRTQWCYGLESMQCVYFEGGRVTGWN